MIRIILLSLLSNPLGLDISRRKFTAASSMLVCGNSASGIGDESVDVSSNAVEVKDSSIYFYGPVTSDSCYSLQVALRDLDKEMQQFAMTYKTIEPSIELHIQSYGGDLLSAFYVGDYIKNLITPVDTFVDSFAASAATVWSVQGRNRYMSENSFILIHQLSTQIAGKVTELSAEMDNINTFMGQLKNVYLENTLMSQETIDSLLAKDLWLNSSQALRYGLVDAII